MQAGQVELVADNILDAKVGSAAVVIETVSDISELPKRDGSIVLEPKLDILIGSVLWALSFDRPSSRLQRDTVEGECRQASRLYFLS